MFEFFGKLLLSLFLIGIGCCLIMMAVSEGGDGLPAAMIVWLILVMMAISIWC